MSYNNLFASDGDLTNSRPVLQLRVAQGAILDKKEERRRDQLKNNGEYTKPYGNEIKITEKGCIPGEIALKKRTTGKPICTIDDIYGGPKDPRLEETLVPHFTHLNQIPIQMPKAKFDALPDDEKRALIENEFQIGGIVGTVAEPAYEGKDLGKEDFVVEIGGIRSIINNSPTHTILQGQLVLARAPDWYKDVTGKKRPRNADGTEPGKVLVVTEPYDPSNVISADTLNKLIRESTKSREHFYKEYFPKNCNGCTIEEGVYLPKHFIQHIINFVVHTWVCCDNPVLPQPAVPRVESDDEDEDAAAVPTHETLLRDKKIAKFLTPNKPDPDPNNPDHYVMTDDGIELIKRIFTPRNRHMKNVIQNMMNSYHKINHRYQSMVLGQAQSDAPPGTRFDIKFGSYCL